MIAGTDLTYQNYSDFAENDIRSAPVWVDSGLKRNLNSFNSAYAKSGFAQKLLVIWGGFGEPHLYYSSNIEHPVNPWVILS